MGNDNKGFALLRLGEVEAGLVKYEEAAMRYSQAIVFFD
jgi:hypothetical protein